jgi:hypothetical protein
MEWDKPGEIPRNVKELQVKHHARVLPKSCSTSQSNAMKTVTYCTHSTITEAWGLILGLPGKPDEEEVSALAHWGRKRFGHLQKLPSVVVMQWPNADLVSPFWQQQLTWDESRLLARIGHRYLSVHFLKKGDERYRTYQESLQPAVAGWLETYDETLLGTREQYPVDRIGFGYVNTFQFPALDFDLSKYFRLSLGIGVEAAQKGLLDLETNFRLFDAAHAADVVINLLVHTEEDEGRQLQVQTKIVAERRGIEECSFKDKDKILVELLRAKKAAKSMFFDFATEETHKIMGAQYASD